MIKKNLKHRRRGFALLEALVASLILGSAVVTLVAVSSRSLYRSKMNRDYDLAWQLVDRQLTLVEAMGIDSFLLEGERQGVTDRFGPEFFWSVDVSSVPLGNLYRVSITVRWQQQNRAEEIVAATMLNGQIGLALVVAEQAR